MINELGHFALILAFAVAIIQVVVPTVGIFKNDNGVKYVASVATLGQAWLLTVAFACLTYSFVVSDFSVRLVFLNSHSLKPMIYKISGVWGNHEGSMLLWGYILALFGAAAVVFGKGLPVGLKSKVLVVQGAIGVAILAFIIFTSNPFIRLVTPPLNGQDLNPLLQDPGLAFHPPFLYLGYVGLSMAFSFAVAALWEGRVDSAWGRWVRPWTLAAWVFLTIGIGLGSWWAYYELGWGGFWFWDPVENASFMPWLFAAALLHSAIVVEKRESLKSWTILLAIFAFGFSLMGTFIVRSGVITSVHAFATDPERGVFILLIMAFFIGGALMLYAYRAGDMVSKGVFGFVSRETFLVGNNILLAVSAIIVMIGTLWPLFAEIFFGEKVSVGAPFFNLTFTPFMIALGFILPFGASMPWKRGNLSAKAKDLLVPFVLAVSIGGLVWSIQEEKTLLGPIGLMLGVWIVVGAILEVVRIPIKQRSLGRLMRTPLADVGKMFAHSGLGITMFAIAGLMAWQIEDIRTTQVGESFKVGKYDFVLTDVNKKQVDNYITTMGEVLVFNKEQKVTTLFPEKRFYPVAGMPTTEASIEYKFLEDIYVVLGDQQDDGSWVVRTYIKPFANWLWGGILIMAFGGLLSIFDRRLRIGVVSRKKSINV